MVFGIGNGVLENVEGIVVFLRVGWSGLFKLDGETEGVLNGRLVPASGTPLDLKSTDRLLVWP